MEQRIKKTGSVQPLSEEGYVINNLSLQLIQPEYQAVIDDTLAFYHKYFGERTHSIYLRGSVAKGMAIPYISDLDTIAISHVTIPKKELYEKEFFWIEMKQKHPFLNGVEVHFETMEQLESSERLQFLLKTQCICIHGEDVRPELPEFGLGTWAYAHSNHIQDGIDQVRKWLDEEENNEEEYKEICCWIMKRTVRIGFELIMEKEQCFTRDLYPCYERFIKHYPQKANEMMAALELAVFPTSDMNHMWNVLDNLTDFLITEAQKRNKGVDV